MSLHLSPRRLCVGVLLCAAALVSLFVGGCGSPESLLKFNAVDITGAGYAQDFRLNAADGGERTLADYRGKVVLLFFGFTQCPDVCPTALTRAVEAKKLLGKDGAKLQALFVTIDPERDIPAVLSEYTHAFDPDFVGLYADVATTRKTAEAFRIFYAKVPTGASYTMDHTATSYLYDTRGQLRLAVRHEDSAQQLADDVRVLLKQP